MWMYHANLVFAGKMEDYRVGFYLEDWMDLPREEGTNMVSPPRVTNIPQPAVVLTIEVGEENFAIP